MHHLVTHGVIITDAIKFVQQQKKDELSIERASFLLKLPEVQQLERILASESEDPRKTVESLYTPTLKRSLKNKVELINWTLRTIELNPNITIPELEISVECKIDSL